jgi:hypothetical protein
MIKSSLINKMVIAPKAMKTVEDRPQDRRAVKPEGKELRRVVGRSTACNEGIRQ